MWCRSFISMSSHAGPAMQHGRGRCGAWRILSRSIRTRPPHLRRRCANEFGFHSSGPDPVAFPRQRGGIGAAEKTFAQNREPRRFQLLVVQLVLFLQRASFAKHIYLLLHGMTHEWGTA